MAFVSLFFVCSLAKKRLVLHSEEDVLQRVISLTAEVSRFVCVLLAVFNVMYDINHIVTKLKPEH